MGLGKTALAFTAGSYNRIIGANDRLVIGLAGLGRRMGGFFEPIAVKEANVRLAYLCDVMPHQRENAVKAFAKHINYTPKTEEDIRRVLEDKQVDVLINATPDHWHTPGTLMATAAGKHVYVEKPCSHNPREGELLVAAKKKHGRLIQMGNQQRSAPLSIDIIAQIHKGVIGNAYEAVAFYTAERGETPVPVDAAPPKGLNWDLFQGPAPRKPYRHNTWDYNWHWYGWDYGTAEAGNNAAHELDVARWALGVDYPEFVEARGEKRHFVNDGWTMYDTMDASFRFPGNKVIKWVGRSRNGYSTYGTGRGTIIYGTEGSVYMDRDGYKLYDRAGKLVRGSASDGKEAGTALGGGGDMTTQHVINFFHAIRGKEKLNSDIEEGVKSTLLCHLINIAYRVNKPLTVNAGNGQVSDEAAARLWGREYQPGWEPVV